MNTSRYIKLAMTLVVFMGITSCEDFLEIPLPSNALFPEQVYSQDRTIAASLNAVMITLQNQDLSILGRDTSLYTDDFTLNNNFNNSALAAMYENKLTPTNSFSRVYNQLYKAIFQVNEAIEEINSTTATLNNKDQHLGEAHFLRAYMFYTLTNMYGDISLPVTSDYETNNTLSRSPQADVFKQIVQDLETATDKLPEFYATGSGEDSWGVKTRPNKIAAKAMLAKAYLLVNENSKAVAACNDVLTLVANPNLIPVTEVFTPDSDAIIWRFADNDDSRTFYTGVYDKSLYLTNWFRWDDFTSAAGYLSESLLNSFEPTDRRYTDWIFTYDDWLSGESYKFPYKYQSDVTGEESFTVLRMADVYLTRAEALANQGNWIDAVADINVVRARAEATLITTEVTDQESALDAVLRERRLEYFNEFSHRFFDLKRMGKIDEVMTAANALKIAEPLPWQPYMKNWPIPASERVANPNISQNSGY